jgi:ATP-dependent Zn protease
MLLSDNRDALDAVIAALLEKETISGDDLADIVGRSRGLVNERGPVVGAVSPNSTS